MTLEKYKDDKLEEETFYFDDVSEKDSLQLILRNLVDFVTSRQRSLADEFKKQIKHGVVRDVELCIVTPRVEGDKLTAFRCVLL
ncbi:hypothetical protein COOONC_00728 [Cooperia oncophora]